jgi:hypothetical protein
VFHPKKEMPHMSILLFSLMIAAAPANTPSTAVPVDVAAARASLNGKWAGTLEYLDYTADKWFGIPVTTQIDDQGDKATTIRKSDFDDGPKVGMVRITSVELFDEAASTLTVGTFRKGRAVDVTTSKLSIKDPSGSAESWVLIDEVLGKDNNRPALLRVTTTRDGDKLESLKEIDFQDDEKSEWITRNRTRLKRIGD